MIHRKAVREATHEDDDFEPDLGAWYPQIAFDPDGDDEDVDFLD